MAMPAPPLNIPPSEATVSVSIIDTTGTIKGVPTGGFMQPTRKGHEHLAVPIFSFIVRNAALGRTILFDLGIRRDWQSLSPSNQRMFEAGGFKMDIKDNVRDVLHRHGVDTDAIEAVVWSHWHFDHTGDPSTFGPGTAVVVGPGFKADERLFPGYPANPDSPILESDYAGHELRELSFADSGITIGRLPAVDYFGDGSFYLLDAPGHAVGHLCGLARVKSSPDSFILMGGDACHHSGMLRPSPYRPLPDVIDPSPLRSGGPVCPGALFEPLLRGADRTRAMYEVAAGPDSFHTDPAETARTVSKLQKVDAADDVFVVLAHDEHLLDIVDFFPKTADDFLAKGWHSSSRWCFLRDFRDGLGGDHDVGPRTSWKNPDL